MFFKQFLDERCGCASYLIASRQSHEAAVIDPALDTRQYDEILPERGFRLRSAIATHVHADHVSGARRLAAALRAACSGHHRQDALHRYAVLFDAANPPVQLLKGRIPSRAAGEALDTLIDFAARKLTPQSKILLPHLGGEISRVAPGAFVYAHREASFVLNINAMWQPPADSAQCIAWARD